MTDSEIIKALECCIKSDHFGECFENKCPMVSANGCKVGEKTLYPYALALIKRQKAEIERLNAEHNDNFKKWKILSERTKERYSELYEEAKGVVRTEAIKEFAEIIKANKKRLFNFIYSERGFDEQIDSLVKEMVGDSDG